MSDEEKSILTSWKHFQQKHCRPVTACLDWRRSPPAKAALPKSALRLRWPAARSTYTAPTLLPGDLRAQKKFSLSADIPIGSRVRPSEAAFQYASPGFAQRKMIRPPPSTVLPARRSGSLTAFSLQAIA